MAEEGEGEVHISMVNKIGLEEEEVGEVEVEEGVEAEEINILQDSLFLIRYNSHNEKYITLNYS